MKKTLFLVVCSLLSFSIHSQSIVGAWETYETAENGTKYRSIVIFSEGYQVIATFEAESGKFVFTNGGSWELEDGIMTETVEFDTENPDRVGKEIRFEVAISEDEIQVVNSPMKLTRLDDGTPGALQGAWLMSGRVRDGETSTRDINRPRKTMKILSGTRFQWIAYNTETKQFMGTGGGTYTTEDGKYVENIEFFSRDDSKAGLSLSFDYELIDGTWHHKGFSSKGDAMHEIWSVRE